MFWAEGMQQLCNIVIQSSPISVLTRQVYEMIGTKYDLSDGQRRQRVGKFLQDKTLKILLLPFFGIYPSTFVVP